MVDAKECNQVREQVCEHILSTCSSCACYPMRLSRSTSSFFIVHLHTLPIKFQFSLICLNETLYLNRVFFLQFRSIIAYKSTSHNLLCIGI